MSSQLQLAAWGLFFVSPLLFVATVQDAYIINDLLVLSMGLVAAAVMMTQGGGGRTEGARWWLLLALSLPTLIQLALGSLPRPWDAFREMLYLCCTWLVFCFAGRGARRLLSSPAWAALLGLFGVVYVLIAVGESFHLSPPLGGDIFPLWIDGVPRFGGGLVQPNIQGLYLAVTTATLWSRMEESHRFWLWGVASLLPCAGLIATASRSGVVVLLAAAALLVLLSAERKRLCLYIAVVVVLALGLSGYWQAMLSGEGGSRWNLLARTIASGHAPRLLIWEICLLLWQQQPWMGIGWGNMAAYGTQIQSLAVGLHPEWGDVASQFMGGHAWCHNIIFQGFVEGGVSAGLALCWLCWRVGMALVSLCRVGSGADRGRVQGALGAAMIVLHGQVSIAALQPFFLVLLALYLAALFPSRDSGSRPPPARKWMAVCFFPALILLLCWWHAVSVSVGVARAKHRAIVSQAFMEGISRAIDDPWLHGDGLHEYFVALLKQHAPASVWVKSETLAYAYWNYYQNQWSLKFLILIAHLKNDPVAERRRVHLFVSAYPRSAAAATLRRHVRSGHVEKEAINIWL